MKTKAKDKKKPKIYTPIGRLSYPYLTQPDSGRENSDDKYKTDLLISKEAWKEEGKLLRQTVLQVGRDFYKDQSLELKDFANPFKEVGEKYSSAKDIKDCILIRCKSQFAPTIVGPKKVDGDWKELPEKDAKAIKGGDYARLVVVVYPYSNKEGGVTLGLNAVQFIEPGPSLGGGRAEALSMLEEIEIEPEDMETDEDEESDNEDESENEKTTSKKSKKSGGKNTDKEDEEGSDADSDDEDETESEDEEEAEETASDDSEEETEDKFDFSDDDEDEEEEKPKKAKGRPAGSKNKK